VPFYMGACWKIVVVHGGKEEDSGSSWGGKEEENEGNTACDGHVTC